MPKSSLSFCVSFHSASHPRKFLLCFAPPPPPAPPPTPPEILEISALIKLRPYNSAIKHCIARSLYVRFVAFSIHCTSRSLRVQFVAFSICVISNALHFIFVAWHVAFSFRCMSHSLYFPICIIAGFVAFSIQCVSCLFYVRFVTTSVCCISNLLYSPFVATQGIQNARTRRCNECNVGVWGVLNQEIVSFRSCVRTRGLVV